MPQTPWEQLIGDRDAGDHDKIIRLSERIGHLQDEVRHLKAKVDLLMSDRAKIIGYCAGVSGLAAILVKLFWPGR